MSLLRATGQALRFLAWIGAVVEAAEEPEDLVLGTLVEKVT